MIQYITYREIDTEGRLCYYILQKEFPHYKGIIALGKLENTLSSATIAGYKMYVNFNGTLRGNLIPSYNDVLKEIDIIMEDMAIWFLNNRILADQKKYSKFKI